MGLRTWDLAEHTGAEDRLADDDAFRPLHAGAGIFAVADRIAVLRLGRSIAVYERTETTQQEVVQAITAGVPAKVSGIPEDIVPAEPV